MANKLFKTYFNEKTEVNSLPVSSKVMIQTSNDEPQKVDSTVLTKYKGRFEDLTEIKRTLLFPSDGKYAYSNDGTLRFYALDGVWQSEELSFAPPDADAQYADIDVMILAQALQSDDGVYEVVDASNDQRVVDRGGDQNAFYRYLGTTNGDLTDYFLFPAFNKGNQSDWTETDIDSTSFIKNKPDEFKEYVNKLTNVLSPEENSKVAVISEDGTKEYKANYSDSKKLDKGDYNGTAQTLKDEIDSINFDGVKVYETLAQAQVVTPVPSDYTGFKVNPLTDTTNAGEYYYLASEPNGTKFYKGYQKDLSYTSINLFNPNTVVSGVYINLGNGNLDNGGANFAVSEWIDINPILDYYIQGRNDTAGDVALRFKNSSGTVLKPYTSQGVEATNFTMPTPNGRFYAPPTAVAVQFTVRFSTATLPNILLINSSVSVDWYVPYKEAISNDEIALPQSIDPKINTVVSSFALGNYLLDDSPNLEQIDLDFQLIDGEFVNAGSGAITSNAGAIRTTEIPVKDDKIYYISGRVTDAGVVFKNSAGTKIKPIDKDGVEQDFYLLNYLNGRLYIPKNAVSVIITTKYLQEPFETFRFYYVQNIPELTNTSLGVKLLLPNEIETFVGDKLQLFKYSMIDSYNPSLFNIQVVSNKVTGINYAGDDYLKYWQFVPSVAEEFDITVYLYSNDGKLIDTSTTKIKVSDNNTSPSSNINVMMMGDSFTFYNRLPDEFKRVLTSNDSLGNTSDTLSDNTVIKLAGKNYNNINLVGTQRANYQGWTAQEFHEGYSGRAWNWFINSSTSPFVSLGTLNFSNYLTVNGISSIDVLYIGLGWNDLFQSMNHNNDTANIEADVKKFLRAVNDQMPNTKVYLWSENFPSLNGGDGAHPYGSDFRTNVHDWKIRLQNVFRVYKHIASDSEFSPYVKFIASHIMFDSENMMQFSQARKNNRLIDTELRGTDDVHPNDGGFFQIADALVRSFIYNHLNQIPLYG